MKALVTNTQAGQAYAIIRSLRPYAAKIVATMDGKHRFAARTSHAANSRLVDRRYYVTSPEADWHAGIIQEQNTEREETYVQRILEICRLEDIDTIFPSYDPLMYIFAKNLRRFNDLGVLIPVPSYETLLIPLDKYATIQAGHKAGFPVPVTYVPKDDADVVRITRELPSPWLLKPRFTAGGVGMAFFTDVSRLREQIGRVQDPRSMPMIQEYVPGHRKQHFYLIADRGEIKTMFCPRVVRHSDRLYRDQSAAAESGMSHLLQPVIATLVRDLKWCGALTIQAKIDIRDGNPKMTEMNPRLGLHLWHRTALGCDEPMMCLKIARGEPVEEFRGFPDGTLLLEPLEDIMRFGSHALDLFLYTLRTRFLWRKALDPRNAPIPFTDLVRSYMQEYFGSRTRVFSPHFNHLLDDPLPCLLWWYAYGGVTLRGIKHLGR
jgi:carbamoyl-phosphate synthase large subunit